MTVYGTTDTEITDIKNIHTLGRHRISAARFTSLGLAPETEEGSSWGTY